MNHQPINTTMVAQKLVIKLVARAEELRKKPKLTAGELHELKRLRMLAKTIKI